MSIKSVHTHDGGGSMTKVVEAKPRVPDDDKRVLDQGIYPINRESRRGWQGAPNAPLVGPVRTVVPRRRLPASDQFEFRGVALMGCCRSTR